MIGLSHLYECCRGLLLSRWSESRSPKDPVRRGQRGVGGSKRADIARDKTPYWDIDLGTGNRELRMLMQGACRVAITNMAIIFDQRFTCICEEEAAVTSRISGPPSTIIPDEKDERAHDTLTNPLEKAEPQRFTKLPGSTRSLT